VKSDRYKTWKGELYLEKHQGTLTNQARNKRYNRKIEKALRELEFAAVLNLPYGNAVMVQSSNS
jgi:alpha-mannosidase